MKHLTVTEAHAAQQQGAIYVDVRSTGEFAAGHPAGAINIPLIEPDEDTGQPQANPDFRRVLQAQFQPDAPLLIGCQMGGRSMRAAQMLESFGFTNVANVRGGFDGARGMMGRETGWVEADLPVETEDEAGANYREQLARADDNK
jgi:rhodanese-related sulfurtransferase